MRATTRLDILHHFAAVPDPRDPRFVTHQEIAQAIRDTGADYLLQVKGDQPLREADIHASIDAALAADFVGFEYDVWVGSSRGHGREEERVCLVLYTLDRLSTGPEWVDVHALVWHCLEHIRDTGRMPRLRQTVARDVLSCLFPLVAAR